MRPNLYLLGAALACASPAIAADSASQAQLQALDARIRALEADGQKLREQAAAALVAADAARVELEKMKATLQAAQQAQASETQTAQQAQATAAVSAVSAPAEASAPNPGGANGNAFNPGIAVILNGNYAHHSLNPDNYQRAGFAIVDGGPIPQGLSLTCGDDCNRSPLIRGSRRTASEPTLGCLNRTSIVWLLCSVISRNAGRTS